MISKKSRKVVAALLIGATVCASGTFAYFNAKTDLKNIEGVANDAQKTLNITNGKIAIQGKLAGEHATSVTSLWGYDVAKVSTVNAMALLDEDGVKSIKERLGLSTDTTVKDDDGKDIPAYSGDVLTYEDVAGDSAYIQKHRSPDIAYIANATSGGVIKDKEYKFDGEDVLIGGTTLQRASIGAKVSGRVIKARPGDAFVLGGADLKDSTKIDSAGITIDNQSNLTTKIGIRLNKGNDGGNSVKAQLNSMLKNGWKVYIKVTNPLPVDKDGNPTNPGISPYADWTQITEDSFNDADDKLTCAVATVKPGEAAPTLQMRVELPLIETGNAYQDLATGNGLTGTNGTDAFDITNLFEIVATQENNPGWNEDGSIDNPVTSSSTTTPAPYKQN